MSTRKVIIGTLVLMLAAATNSLAQIPVEGSQHFAVKVIVDADENIQNLAERYIFRELRSRTDVIIVEESAEWELRFNVTVLSTHEGEKLGFAMAVTAARHHSTSMLQEKFPDTLDQNVISDYLGASYISVDTFLHVGPVDGLRELCGRAVADIDISNLERQHNIRADDNPD